MSVARGERAFVALGSNLGERAATLDGALAALAATPGLELRARSGYHETAPVGGPPGQGPFLNAVAELATRLAPHALLERLHAIERDFGRRRSAGRRDEPRTLDLDLLLQGERRLDDARLTLPHPRMEERTFVLAPLAELAPELVLPRCGRSVRERLAELQRDPAAGARA